MNPARSLAVAALLTGCGPDGPAPTTTRPHTGDTGTVPTTFDGFVPYAFGVTEAQFAVSPTGDAGAWTGADGSPRAASLTVTVVDETVTTQGVVPGNSCTVTWSWTGSSAPATAPTTSAWVWWIADVATAFPDDGCAALEFPPAWGDDPRAVLEHWTYGFGLGPLDPEVRASLERVFGDDFPIYEPYLGGGGTYWDGLRVAAGLDAPDRWRTGWVDTGVVYGYELDADGREVLAAGQPVTLEADTLWDGSAPRAARYHLQGTTLLTPASAVVPREE